MSPRPPANSSAMKEGSASQSKRGNGKDAAAAASSSAAAQAGQNSITTNKDLTMRGAREEAKTIDTPATGTGSAG